MSRTVQLTHTSRGLLVALALSAAPLVACTGTAVDAVGANQVHAGHGKSSVPADQLAAATADENVAQSDGLGSTSEALSSSTGSKFALTYYVVSLRPQGDPDEVEMVDCNGTHLTMASTTWRDDAEMQGTARYKGSDGNMHTINAGSGCWVTLPSNESWGFGVDGPKGPYALSPFRSIAVDTKVLKLGRWYYVKELDGVRMPSPTSNMVHDGCVRAVDVGPAIKGRHIDFFSAYFTAYETLINGSSTMGGKESITLYDGARRCASHVSSGS